MTAIFYNSSFGNGLEGIINYSNYLFDWWFVPVFIFFIFLAIIITMSSGENKRYPMSAIIAYALLIVLISTIIFKLMTQVQEYFIYIIAVGIGLAIAWGIWQNR